ncbi:MAG: hypothetical protein OHK0029_22260 [Armatimonadaceae bacterium]
MFLPLTKGEVRRGLNRTKERQENRGEPCCRFAPVLGVGGVDVGRSDFHEFAFFAFLEGVYFADVFVG